MLSTSAVYLNKLRRIRSWTIFFCKCLIFQFSFSVWIHVFFKGVVGLILAGYALFVEHKKAQDDSYTAMCDIDEHMSCSKVFTSK